MLGHYSDSSDDKIKYYALAAWSTLSAFTNNILKCFEVFENNEFRTLYNSLLSGIQKIVGDGGVNGW